MVKGVYGSKIERVEFIDKTNGIGNRFNSRIKKAKNHDLPMFVTWLYGKYIFSPGIGPLFARIFTKAFFGVYKKWKKKEKIKVNF